MPAQHISYRLPFGFSNILERDKKDIFENDKNNNNGNSTVLKKLNLASSHLKQQMSKTILELVKSIISNTPIELAEDEITKIIEILKDDLDVLEINYLEVGENFLKVKIGEEQGHFKINFDKSDLFIHIDRDNPQSTGDVQKIVEKLDKFFLEMGKDRVVYKYKNDGAITISYFNRDGIWESGMQGFIGIDVGSVSTNVVFIDNHNNVIDTVYTYTRGQVLNAIKTSLEKIQTKLPENITVLGVGVTGSSGELAKKILNADIYKTEIYSHAAATIHQIPNVGTILEIGGQDSKVIYVNNGKPEKSKMNEWCGAGTGAMLDAQSNRVGIPIEDIGDYALRAKKSIDFRTRCGVFMDSCMIDAQAKGYPIEVILSGLCRACAHNFVSTLGINRKGLKAPIAFQGGVAANKGVKKELSDYISKGRDEKCELIVPLYHDVMGALGMSLIVSKLYNRRQKPTSFRGFEEVSKITYEIVECDALSCPKNKDNKNLCDVVLLQIENKPIATIGACDEYQNELLKKGPDKEVQDLNSETNRSEQKYSSRELQ